MKLNLSEHTPLYCINAIDTVNSFNTLPLNKDVSKKSDDQHKYSESLNFNNACDSPAKLSRLEIQTTPKAPLKKDICKIHQRDTISNCDNKSYLGTNIPCLAKVCQKCLIRSELNEYLLETSSLVYCSRCIDYLQSINNGPSRSKIINIDLSSSDDESDTSLNYLISKNNNSNKDKSNAIVQKETTTNHDTNDYNREPCANMSYVPIERKTVYYPDFYISVMQNTCMDVEMNHKQMLRLNWITQELKDEIVSLYPKEQDIIYDKHMISR